jgi:hypothetical protein
MKYGKQLLASLVLCSMFAYGCSTAWVTTLDDILVAAAPALINILNIVAIAKGQPVNLALSNKITTDAATVKTLANDFATASAAAAPTACAQLQSAINVYSADQTQVMSLAQVSDPATETKIETLSALVSGTVVAITAVIPNCQQAAQFKAALEKSAVPLPLKTFVKSYNNILTTKTGNQAVDGYTKSHGVHVHSKFVRVITLGLSY